MNKTDSLIYVIFGASGDLTKRKLIPALYSLFVQKFLPEKFALVGASRSLLTDGDFRESMKAAIHEFKEIDDTSGIDEFIEKLHYTAIRFDEVSSYLELKKKLEKLRIK